MPGVQNASLHVCGPAFACGAASIPATITEAVAITVTRTLLLSHSWKSNSQFWRILLRTVGHRSPHYWRRRWGAAESVVAQALIVIFSQIENMATARPGRPEGAVHVSLPGKCCCGGRCCR